MTVKLSKEEIEAIKQKLPPSQLSNSPVTEEPEKPKQGRLSGLLTDTAENLTALNQGMSSSFLGLMDPSAIALRVLGMPTVNDVIAGRAGQSFDRSRGVESSDDLLARAERLEADNPNFTTGGQVLGDLAVGVAAGAAAPALAPNLMAATGAGGLLGRSVLGAGENVLLDLPENVENSVGIKDFLARAGKSAAYGAGGQGVGELIGKGAGSVVRRTGLDEKLVTVGNALKRRIPGLKDTELRPRFTAERQGTKRAVGDLMDEMPYNLDDRALSVQARTRSKQPYTQDRLQTLIDDMRPGEHLMDTDRGLAGDTMRLLSDTENLMGEGRDLVETAYNRLDNAETAAHNIVRRHLSPATSTADQVADYAAKRTKLGEKYRSIVTSPDAKAPTIPRQRLINEFQRKFMQADDLSTVGEARDWLGKEVSKHMGVNKRGKINQTATSPADVLSLKKAVDDRINRYYKGEIDNADKASIAYLSSVKRYLNNILASTMPKAPDGTTFRNLSTQFATNEQQNEMFELGTKMFTQTKTPPDMFQDFVDSLDGPEKDRFVEGALSAFQNKPRGEGLTSLKAGLKQNTAERKKLEILLGPGKVDAFLDDAERFITQLDNAASVAASVRGGGRPKVHNPYAAGAYAAATAAAAATGHTTSAVYSGSRLFGKDPVKQQALKSVMDLYNAGSQEAAQRQLNDLIQAAMMPESRMLGAAAASAMPPSLMDE